MRKNIEEHTESNYNNDIHQIRNIFFWGGRVIRSNDIVIETNPQIGNHINDSVESRSDNEKYPSFALPQKEITGMALVVGVIRLE